MADQTYGGDRRDHASSSPEERTVDVIGEASANLLLALFGAALMSRLVQPSIRLASYFLMSRDTSDNQRVSPPAFVLQSSVDLLPDGRLFPHAKHVVLGAVCLFHLLVQVRPFSAVPRGSYRHLLAS